MPKEISRSLNDLKRADEIARHAADAQDYHHAYFTLAKAVEEFLRQSDGR